MTDNEIINNELLEAVKLAYRKHHCGDDSIGWNELDDKLYCVLANVMGDEGFVKWIRGLEK